MIISLITDFGSKDYFVGSLKGVILTINPLAHLVDVSHDITPYDIRAAMFVLREAYPYFPKRTIHIAVVDPGVGGERQPIIVEGDGHLFVGPDNGVFSFVLKEAEATAIHITNRKYSLDLDSPTFQGRDIFAPVAAWLSKGIPPQEFGPALRSPKVILNDTPREVHSQCVQGEIVYIDHFGNLITNITASPKEANPKTQLKTAEGMTYALKKCYSEGNPTVPAAIINSSGYFEIFLNGGSAKDYTKVEVGDPIFMEM